MCSVSSDVWCKDGPMNQPARFSHIKDVYIQQICETTCSDPNSAGAIFYSLQRIMKARVLLCLLWSLVEVHSQQTFPHISFMGDILLNHSYVDLSRVGEDGGDPGNTVKCITDLISCCSVRQNDIFGTDHRGNWFAPGRDTRLPFRNERGDIYEDHGDQESEIHRRNNADMPFGIYRCDIPTNAVHDDAIQSVRESVFVGLYAGGGITNFVDVYLSSQLIEL